MKTGEIAGNHIVIRADADTRMGSGHLMRCLALAQAWQDAGGQVTFLTASDSKVLKDRLRSEGMDGVNLMAHPGSNDDAIETANLAQKSGAVWVAVDGYHFDSEYQRLIKESGLNLLLIDDIGYGKHYWADIVLNQNIHANEGLYSIREPYTCLLLGTSYVLLRREFLNYREWTREIPEVARKVLVTLGGGDSDNVTLKVIQALNRMDCPELEVRVVVGPSNPNKKLLINAMRHAPCSMFCVENASNMSELMAWADIAVTAGGSTCWEMAYMGLPNVIVVLAENQQANAESLGSGGISINLGWYNEIDKLGLTKAISMLIFNQKLRKEMSAKARKLVDGTGTNHILSSIDKLARHLHFTEDIKVRRACIKDGELLWKWANNQSVRANAFHTDTIFLKDHIRWFQNKLNSPGTLIWILELGKNPIAQIRYDRVNTDTAEIDLSVTTDCCGMGLGTKALVLTSDISGKELGVKRIKGIVFVSNKASSRAFTKAGFKLAGQERIADKICDIFIRECAETVGEAF